MMAERRKLKRWERNLLFRLAGGKCSEPHCKIPLPPNWHADHTVPLRISGRTNVYEMKAMCPQCNLKKGSKYVPE